jgi:hypothetical protein
MAAAGMTSARQIMAAIVEIALFTFAPSRRSSKFDAIPNPDYI